MKASDSPQIQTAFRKAIARIFIEVNAEVPDFPDGALQGESLRKDFLAFPERNWAHLGFKPEHIRLLLSLCLALQTAARVDATPQNVTLLEFLFQPNPAKPITMTMAEAHEDLVKAFVDNIGPKPRSWWSHLLGRKP